MKLHKIPRQNPFLPSSTASKKRSPFKDGRFECAKPLPFPNSGEDDAEDHQNRQPQADDAHDDSLSRLFPVLAGHGHSLLIAAQYTTALGGKQASAPLKGLVYRMFTLVPEFGRALILQLIRAGCIMIPMLRRWGLWKKFAWAIR